MSGNSSVGGRAVYESGDQKHYSQAEIREAQRNQEHPAQTSLRDSMNTKDEHPHLQPSEEELTKSDPGAPAKMHGNQPSRGAEIDAELRREDEERLRQKGQK